MKFKTAFFILFTISLTSICLNAQSPVGVWKTIDDKTNEAKSQVEIYEANGKFYGKIIKVLTDAPSKICNKCSGDKKDKPIIGLIILEDLKKVKDYWGKGTITDPENGKEYGCSVWFEKNKANELKVRGKHWTGLYRTQTWYRVK